MRHWSVMAGMAIMAVAGLQPALAEGKLAPVFIEEMTWKEVGDALEAGRRTVIVPTGGTEQNGLHMVTGKHNYIVRVAAERIARESGDALVAPVIAYVPEGGIRPPQGHMRYTGTISLSEDTFERMLTDTARSFRQHGFTLICFLGDSGGNQESQRRVAENLSAEWAKEGVRVVQLGDYYAHNGQDEWLRGQGIGAREIDGHAAIGDTSELLEVYPAGIRAELLDAYDKDGGEKTGATGSARQASSAYGKKLLEMKISAAVRQIRSYQKNR